MTRSQQLSSGAALLVGLAFVAAGVLPMLVAFDIGPLGREDIEGPSWLGFVGGGILVAAGLAVIAGPQARLASGLFGILALAGLAAIGNWIAFGAGQRACAGSLSLPWLWSEGDFAGLACRISFGLGVLSPTLGRATRSASGGRRVGDCYGALGQDRPSPRGPISNRVSKDHECAPDAWSP